MTRDRDEIVRSRHAARTRYGDMFDWLSELLFRHDPMGLSFAPKDEYEPEVETILPKLSHCRSELDVRTMLQSEFVRWFSPADAGPPERYAAAAREIWFRLAAEIESQRVFVRLVGENVDVWRPTRARPLENGRFEMLEVAPTGEAWEHQAPAVVHCDWRTLSDGRHLVVISSD